MYLLKFRVRSIGKIEKEVKSFNCVIKAFRRHMIKYADKHNLFLFRYEMETTDKYEIFHNEKNMGYFQTNGERDIFAILKMKNPDENYEFIYNDVSVLDYVKKINETLTF
jgi:hypothetical protein